MLLTSAHFRTLVLLFCLSTLGGCSQQDGPTRYKVSGQVTINGKPAPAFHIFFRPDSAKGNSGPGAKVRGQHGLYETRPNKGVSIGPHLVEIMAFNGVPNSESNEGDALTKAYTTSVSLPAEDSEQNFDVPVSHLVQ
jgi:hypothetical protein